MKSFISNISIVTGVYLVFVLTMCSVKVLIVGLGALGCPSAHYLAAAGVGTLGLLDDDIVDASNLHRQVIVTVTGNKFLFIKFKVDIN